MKKYDLPSVEELLSNKELYGEITRLIKKTYNRALWLQKQTEEITKGAIYEDGNVNTTYIALNYFNMEARAFNKMLYDLGYLEYRDKCGYRLAPKYANKGYQEKRELHDTNREYFYVWTQTGLQFLLDEFDLQSKIYYNDVEEIK